MALKPITPFTYPAFIAEAGETIKKLVDHFNDGDPDFWLNALRRYSFRGQDYLSGEEVRLQFNVALSSCSGQGELHAVANRILEWGGMAPLDATMKEGLLPSLSSLRQLARGASVDLRQLCVERLASITKVYEMWDLDNWVIYDSYCVRGLQWLISGFWAAVGHKQNEGLLKLPWPPGRAGSPVAGFPRAADTAPKQQRLGFIYGSWVCKAMAERLSSSAGLYWRPYHVEMLAFQLGHEIQRRLVNGLTSG
jgi:hypothetical protein